LNTLVERLLQGDRRALARMVTLIENEAPQARRYLAALHQHTGQAQIIGVTGSPGAGKSTLVTRMVRELRARGHKIGVIAIDPSSPFSGGAILGDRIRMMELAGDPMIFIRSMASRGNLGGLAAATGDVVRAMDAAGYNPIIIETVGTGQSEIAIMRIAHTVLVTLAPGMGDDIQAIKAGILEIADIFVVSKADRPGADQTAAELSMLLSLDARRRQAAWRIPIIKTSSYKEQGIVELIDKVQQHYTMLSESDQLAQRAQRQVRSEIQHLILQAVAKALDRTITPEEWEHLIEAVNTRERDPYSVAIELEKRLGLYHQPPESNQV
jgi:LAO/AO transport system ATPase